MKNNLNARIAIVASAMLLALSLNACKKTENGSTPEEKPTPIVNKPDSIAPTPVPDFKVESQTSANMPLFNQEIKGKVYLGAIVMAKEGGNPDLLNIIPVDTSERNPITMYATFPTDSVYRKIQKPSKEVDLDYLRAAIKAGSLRTINNLQYGSYKFNRFADLEKYFESNVSPAKFFNAGYGDDDLIVKKTKIAFIYTQENFSVNIEPPIYAPFLKGKLDLTKYGDENPLIVSSLTYGNKVMFTLLSDDEYNDVNAALNTILNQPYSVLIDQQVLLSKLTPKTIEILNKAKVSAYVYGQSNGTVYPVNGLEAISAALTKIVPATAENPGVPLYYSLNYVKDFATFRYKFDTKAYSK